MAKDKDKKKKNEQFREDVSDLHKSFVKDRKTRKRRNEKRFMREIGDGEYSADHIDNFEKW